MKREDLVNNFKLTLQNMSLEQFSRLFINEVTAVEEFYKLCHGVNAGKTISLLFNPHRLNIVTEHSISRTSAPMSIFQSLSDKGSEAYTEKLDGLARLYLYNLEHGVVNPLYATIQRGYNGVTYVNEFPPYVARQIIQKYANTSEYTYVLDPCGGWGGRMIGCAIVVNLLRRLLKVYLSWQCGYIHYSRIFVTALSVLHMKMLVMTRNLILL